MFAVVMEGLGSRTNHSPGTHIKDEPISNGVQIKAKLSRRSQRDEQIIGPYPSKQSVDDELEITAGPRDFESKYPNRLITDHKVSNETSTTIKLYM
jgi:hypothetical protein